MGRVAPYAVIFKTFTMDDFAMRQLRRLQSAAGAGNIYVMIDETAGPAGAIAHERVIRYRESDLLALGFAPYAEGSLFWYNADYPLYYFQHLHPEYDVIVMIEYDAVANIGFDGLVEKFRREKLDFVAEPISKPVDQYWWTNSMLHFYPIGLVRPYLICAAIFSRAAIQHMAACRLEQGQDARVVDAAKWPLGEAYVGSELSKAGFQIRTLSAFGSLSRYNWWPPTHENELPDLAGEAFLHPVLIGRSYVKSVFKNGYRTGFLNMMRRNWPKLLCVVVLRSLWRRGLTREIATVRR